LQTIWQSRPLRTALAALATLVMLALILWPKTWLPAREASPRLVPHADKLIHFGLFAVCGGLWMAAGGRRLVPVVLTVGLVLAVATEYVQGFPLISRDPDPLDALADSVGVIAAVLVWRPWRDRPATPVEAAAFAGAAEAGP